MSDLVVNSSDAGLSEPGTSPTASRIACRQCSERLDSGDNFCRYCGGLTEAGAAMVKVGKLPPPASREIAEKPLSWTESRVVVLLLLFAVLGPIALPMLWRSRRFTRGWKIGLTVAVLLMTVALCWYSAKVVMDAWQKAVDEYNEYKRMGLM